jgi:hypothetical protein
VPKAIYLMAGCACLLAVMQFFALAIPPYVLIYGLRTNFLHFPLIFVIGEAFRRPHLKSMGKWAIIAAVPMAILMAYQFRSSPDAWINRGVGVKGGQQLAAAFGHIRPPGTFSFISGPILFYGLVTAYVGWAFTSGSRSWSKLISLSGVAAIGLACAVAGSRSLVITAGIVAAATIAGGVASRRGGTLITHMVLLSIPVYLVLGEVDVVQDGKEVLMARWEMGETSQGAGDGGVVSGKVGGLIERFMISMTGPLRWATDIPALGLGLGVGTNVGAALATGEMGFLLSEGEWGRLLLEMGPFLGLAFVVFRILLTVWLGRRALAAIRGDTLSLLLFSACAPNVINGQIGQPSTLGFTVLVAGLCLAAANSAGQAGEEVPGNQNIGGQMRMPFAVHGRG